MCVMYMKCLLNAVATAALAVGLSACDDGKIRNDYFASESGNTDEAIEDLTLMDAIQRRVFSAHCIQCHGGSNHAAAGLYLTEELARQNLLDVTSEVDPTKKRVVVGNHEQSLLWQAVATDISRDWAYDHSQILTNDAVYLMATWIDLEN